MSTRSYIGIVNEDQSIDMIYCHFDGYPTGVGQKLLDHYTSETKIRELIALGDISKLAKNVVPPEGTEHSFDEPVKGVVVAYHRDRGEEWKSVKPCKKPTFADAFKVVRDSWGEYIYLFCPDGSWTCTEIDRDAAADGQKQVPLVKAIKRDAA